MMMNSSEPTVFVVDDDERVRSSVCALVGSMQLRSESFATAEEFLNAFDKGRPGCLVTDARLIGMSGFELQERLNDMNVVLPVIVITGYARTSLTVRAMQAGAFTILDKPYHDDELWRHIRDALMLNERQRMETEHRATIRNQIASLTPSERQVAELVIGGKPNKAIARKLDLSIRTVENRRRDIYAKLGVENVIELVRIFVDAGFENSY